jgi:phenylacetate-CoA ligase
MAVRVERRDDELEGDEDRARAAVVLREQVKARIGVSVDVEIVEPAGLLRSAGKAKRVRDERQRGAELPEA